MADLLDESARQEREERHWQLALSPVATEDAFARFGALETAHRRVLKLDEFMERKGAEKRARAEAQVKEETR